MESDLAALKRAREIVRQRESDRAAAAAKTWRPAATKPAKEPAKATRKFPESFPAPAAPAPEAKTAMRVKGNGCVFTGNGGWRWSLQRNGKRTAGATYPSEGEARAACDHFIAAIFSAHTRTSMRAAWERRRAEKDSDTSKAPTPAAPPPKQPSPAPAPRSQAAQSRTDLRPAPAPEPVVDTTSAKLVRLREEIETDTKIEPPAPAAPAAPVDPDWGPPDEGGLQKCLACRGRGSVLSSGTNRVKCVPCDGQGYRRQAAA